MRQRPNSRSQKIHGLTLVELLVVIALVGILSMIAIPSLRDMVMRNRIQAASSEFQSALAMARGEAIKRGGDAKVTIVANTGTAAIPNWASGVTVFYDTTSNANGNVPSTDATTLLMSTSPVSAGVTSTSNLTYITFNGFGRTVSTTGAPLGGTVAFGATDSTWRCVIINLQGRSRTVELTNANYVANGCGAL